MNNNLEIATKIIAKAADGQHLTAEESESAFADVFLYDTEGYLYLALCTALHAKRETADELFGLCNSTAKLGVKINPNIPSDKITDLSGTGGGIIKTINVSTLASFIVSARGYTVAKQAMFGMTSPTGSADIFNTFGINVFNLKFKQVINTLERVGICPLFLAALSPKLANRSRLVKLVFYEKGLQLVKNPFNIATFAYSPTPLKKRLYGCYSEKYLKVLGELFAKLGNKRTMVVYGVGGIPEVSNIGETIVVEQNEKNLKQYYLTPQDFGLRKANVEEIQSGGKEQNICDFLKIIYGKEKGAKRDLVLANASAAFYVLGEVDNFKEGVRLALSLIDNQLASNKLEELVKEAGQPELLHGWQKKVFGN